MTVISGIHEFNRNTELKEIKWIDINDSEQDVKMLALDSSITGNNSTIIWRKPVKINISSTFYWEKNYPTYQMQDDKVGSIIVPYGTKIWVSEISAISTSASQDSLSMPYYGSENIKTKILHINYTDIASECIIGKSQLSNISANYILYPSTYWSENNEIVLNNGTYIAYVASFGDFDNYTEENPCIITDTINISMPYIVRYREALFQVKYNGSILGSYIADCSSTFTTSLTNPPLSTMSTRDNSNNYKTTDGNSISISITAPTYSKKGYKNFSIKKADGLPCLEYSDADFGRYYYVNSLSASSGTISLTNKLITVTTTTVERRYKVFFINYLLEYSNNYLVDTTSSSTWPSKYGDAVITSGSVNGVSSDNGIYISGRIINGSQLRVDICKTSAYSSTYGYVTQKDYSTQPYKISKVKGTTITYGTSSSYFTIVSSFAERKSEHDWYDLDFESAIWWPEATVDTPKWTWNETDKGQFRTGSTCSHAYSVSPTGYKLWLCGKGSTSFSNMHLVTGWAKPNAGLNRGVYMGNQALLPASVTEYSTFEQFSFPQTGNFYLDGTMSIRKITQGIAVGFKATSYYLDGYSNANKECYFTFKYVYYYPGSFSN